jgi:pyridoxine 4-dehydrogenase
VWFNRSAKRLFSLTVFYLLIGQNSVGSLQHKELQSLVDTACENHIGFFDTAERYGSSLKTAVGLGWGETEQLTKRLLMQQSSKQSNNNNNSRPAAQVATKFTPSPWRTTVQSVVDACEDSRKRLGVDQIDLYQLHMPDIVQPFQRFGSKPKDTVYWQGLAECYHRGLVKNIGVSNYRPTLLSKCQQLLSAEGVPLASNQIAYSLLGRHNGSQETLDYCNNNNIRVLAFFPLAMGLLTGKYQDGPASRSANKNGDSLKVSKKSSIETRDLVAYSKRISPLLDAMQTMAEKYDKTVAQVALNYIVCQGAIPIPGARTQQQLVDNAGAMGWRLSATEIEQLAAASDRLGFGFDGAGFKRASEKFVGYGMETWTLD